LGSVSEPPSQQPVLEEGERAQQCRTNREVSRYS
jgi:hypothetical protein